MPDLIKAAIPGPDFFHRMPIGVGVCPSAAGQAQAVATVGTVDQPGQQGFGTPVKCRHAHRCVPAAIPVPVQTALVR